MHLRRLLLRGCVQPLAEARGSWMGANPQDPPASAGGCGPKLHLKLYVALSR